MGNKIDFVYLNEEDMLKAGVSDVKGCLKSMEDMFILLHKGDYRMGGENNNDHGIVVYFPDKTDIENMPVYAPDYRFMAMPAYLGGRFHMFGIKTYGSHNTNREKGLPRSILMMQLLDIDTGAPLAYMSANVLSAMRTACAAGVGTKYLSKKDPKVLGIVGPGVMSTYTLEAIIETQPSIEVLKVKGRGKESLNKFLDHAKRRHPHLKEIVAVDSIEEACKDSDIVYFGTTNAKKFEDNPRVEKEWIKKGATIISGSALVVDTDFLAQKGVRIVADNYKMYEIYAMGYELPTQRTVSPSLGMAFYDVVNEKKIRREDVSEIGAIIAKDQEGRKSEDEIIFYSVGGMAIEDVAWGYDVYQNAIKNNIGFKLNLWESPELEKFSKI